MSEFIYPLSEKNYEAQLRESIHMFLQEQIGWSKYNSETTNNNAQRPERFNKSYCADLIIHIDRHSLLLLEVKVTNTTSWKLQSYNKRQHKFLRVLERANLPILFCYNLLPHYRGRQYNEVLINSNTSTPCAFVVEEEKIKDQSRHKLLLEVIKEKLGNVGGSDLLGVLTDAGAIDYLGTLNTHFLLLIYNWDKKQLMVLNQNQIQEFAMICYEALQLIGSNQSRNLDFDKITEKEIGELVSDRLKLIKERAEDLAIAIAQGREISSSNELKKTPQEKVGESFLKAYTNSWRYTKTENTQKNRGLSL